MRTPKLKIFGLIFGVFLFAVTPLAFVHAQSAQTIVDLQVRIEQLLAQITALQPQMVQQQTSPRSADAFNGVTSMSAENSVLGALNKNPLSMAGAKSISGVFKNMPITLTTADAFAGAIFSLTWNGKEFINSWDHGRELQSASSFDGNGECFNPTEAGSASDLQQQTSTSKLLSLSANNNVLHTLSQMAFWIRPGETAPDCGSAVNTTALSTHTLEKTVTIGFLGIPNVIEHKVTFHVTEPHTSGVFEVLTGYMPWSFSKFFAYDPTNKKLMPLSGAPDAHVSPAIVSTQDESYAMGVYSPDFSQPSEFAYGSGRFAFADPANTTTKWNCVFRETNIVARDYPYRCYSIIGTLTDVTAAMDKLHSHFKETLGTVDSTYGAIHVRAAVNGILVPAGNTTPFNVKVTGPNGATVQNFATNVNADYANKLVGTYSVNYVNGAPAGYVFKELNGNFTTNPVSQSLSAGGDITYTFNFSCAAGYIQNGAACVSSTAATQTTTGIVTSAPAGTIHVRATLNGAPVTSPHTIVFDYTSPIGVLTQNILSDVLHDYPNMPVGTHTVAYRSVNKPAVFVFQGINDNYTTNLSQTLSATNNPVTFTFKFNCAAGYTPNAQATTADGLCTGTGTTNTVTTSQITTQACIAVPQTPVSCSGISTVDRNTYGISTGATSGNASYTKNSCTGAIIYTGGCSVPAVSCTAVAKSYACSSITDAQRTQYGIPAGATSGTASYTENSCTGAIIYTGGCSVPAPGTVHIRATFNGVPVSVANVTSFNVSYTSPTNSSANFVTNTNADYPGAVAGNYTANYAGGAPAGVVFQNVTPSTAQTLTAGGDITFTFNFTGPTSMIDSNHNMANILEAARQALGGMWKILSRP